MNRLLKITGAVTLLIIASVVIIGAVNPDFKIAKNMDVLSNIFREVNLIYVDDVDPDKLLQDAAMGITRNLDPYTEFLPESEMENFEIMTTGKYGGIGSLIKKEKGSEYVQIAQPYKNSPADKAGLKIDDKIVAIDGVNLKNAASEKVSALMKGDPGTSFRMLIERDLDNSRHEINLKRERITISGVPYYGYVDKGVGYVLLENFTENCSEDIKKAIMEMKAQGDLQALILDLRNNGGGILQEAVKIVSMFVPKGTEVVSIKGKIKEIDKIYHTESEPIDTKVRLAVMVNGQSASASEIVAGALQDMDRAVIIGQRSFGKGLVQATRPVGYNSFLKVTTAKYYIPSGRCIQAINYSRRDASGKIEHIPDSLIREYKTASGRKVYDGAGIMPDVRIDETNTSIFTISLYNQGYIEDFGRELYRKRINSGAAGKRDFNLSEQEYNDFVKFMDDKEVEYESETDAVVKSLRTIATREKYLSRIEKELQDIENRIKADKNNNITLYKSEIVPLIENEVILREKYKEGVIKHTLESDAEVKIALKTLSEEQYSKIIRQDTQRK